MATPKPRKTSDTTEDEEMRLEAELRVVAVDRKAVFETTRESDEHLRKLREKERQAQDRLHQIRAEKIERDQRERHAARLEAERKTTKGKPLEAELRAQFEALKIENDQLKRQMAKDANERRTLASRRGNEREELEILRRRNSDLLDNLQRTTSFSRKQQKEKREKEKEIVELARRNKSVEENNARLLRRNKCLEDEVSAARQIAAETQLRQLNELQSLTNENRELKQTLTDEVHRQRQQPAASQQHHHPGNKCRK